MAEGYVPKIPVVQSGNFEVSLSGSAEVISYTINFPFAFDKVPNVTLTLSDTARGYTDGAPLTSAMITSVSTNNCGVKIKTAPVYAGGIICYWIAVA